MRMASLLVASRGEKITFVRRPDGNWNTF